MIEKAAEDPGWLDKFFDPAWNNEHSTYIWLMIFGILVMTGLGLPLPEDIWMSLAGFTAFTQGDNQFVLGLFVMGFFVCSGAAVLGDIGAYSMGRRYGFGIRDRFKFLRRLLSEKRLHRVQGWFQNYGAAAVFLGRQVAGVRFVTFFTAGTMRMGLAKFMLWDFLGCLVSVPVWMTLGALAAKFGKPWMETKSKTVVWAVLLGVLAVVLVFLIVARVRQARREAAGEPEFEADAQLSSKREIPVNDEQ